MATGLGFTKARKMKGCSKCGDVKSIREFDIHRDRENYGNRMYHKDICIDCEQPPDHGEKFCHCCMKYKPLSNYRRYLLGRVAYKEIVTANNCRECEDQGATEKEWTDVRPTESDADKIDWYCAFIGDRDYKDICSIYNIKYKPIKDNRSYKAYNERKLFLKQLEDELRRK